MLAPADSLRYWTDDVFDPRRIGDPAYAGNQSLRGMAARLFSTAEVQQAVWAVAALATLVLGIAAMRGFLRRGQPTFALLVNALIGLLVSPVSWSHHWVWAAPALLALVACGYRSAHRPMLLVAGLAAALFAGAPQRMMPYDGGRELGWTIWQQIPGNLYVISGFAALMLAAWAARGAATSLQDIELLGAPRGENATRGLERV